MGGQEERLQARLEEGVGGALESITSGRGRSRRRAAVGDPAAQLVDHVDADQDADLAPGIAPALGQLLTQKTRDINLAIVIPC